MKIEPRKLSLAKESILIGFGESVARQAQDEQPLTHQGSVRPASVDYWLRSHPPHHRHCGMKVSAIWPLLARLSFAPSTPARPFGLGCRFSETPSGNGASFLTTISPEVATQPEMADDPCHKISRLANRNRFGYSDTSRHGSLFLCRSSARDNFEPRCAATHAGAFARPGPLQSQSYIDEKEGLR